jgi:hypothetical protein
VADRKQIDENETLPGEEQITPWDVIDQEDWKTPLKPSL